MTNSRGGQSAYANPSDADLNLFYLISKNNFHDARRHRHFEKERKAFSREQKKKRIQQSLRDNHAQFAMRQNDVQLNSFINDLFAIGHRDPFLPSRFFFPFYIDLIGNSTTVMT